MTDTRTSRGLTMRKYVIVGAVAVALAVGAPGCAKKYAAERDGKDLGEAICDLVDADSADEVTDAASDVNSALESLAHDYSAWTAQDRAAIDENLSDLEKHVADGDTALVRQDLAVIQRNVNQASKQVNDTDEAALDGIEQGLADCTQ